MDRLKIRRLLARGTAYTFGQQIASRGLRFALHLFLARWMGVEGYGLYAFATGCVLLLEIPSQLGLNTAALRFVPQYLSSGDSARLAGLLRSSRRRVAMTSTVLAIGGAAVTRMAAPEAQRPALYVASVLLPVASLVALNTETLRAAKRVVAAYGPSLVLQPGLALGAAALYHTAVGPLGPATAMGAVVLGYVLALAVQAVLLRSTFHGRLARQEDLSDRALWHRVAFPLLLVASFVIVLRQSDIVMLGVISAERQVGLYGAAVRYSALASFALGSVNALAAPMIAEAHATKDRAALETVVRTATRWAFVPSVLLALVLWIAGRPLLGLFGSDFTAAYAALCVLTVGQLANASFGPVGYLVNLTGHERYGAAVYGGAAAMNVLLNAVLIPLAGALGAAVATASSMLAWNVALFVFVRRRLGIRALPL